MYCRRRCRQRRKWWEERKLEDVVGDVGSDLQLNTRDLCTVPKKMLSFPHPH